MDSPWRTLWAVVREPDAERWLITPEKPRTVVGLNEAERLRGVVRVHQGEDPREIKLIIVRLGPSER